MIINCQAIPSSLIQREPFLWGLASDIFVQSAQIDLTDAYPRHGFTRCARTSGPQKHYSFELLNLVVKDQVLDETKQYIDDKWLNMATSLLSVSYKQSVSQKLGINLDSTTTSIGFYKFGQNDFVSPHVDNENKVLTQIFYFNRFWDKSWGGDLKILGSKKPDDVIFSLAPLSNFSTLIARSEHAWHMVSPVTAHASSPRLSLQLEFIRSV